MNKTFNKSQSLGAPAQIIEDASRDDFVDITEDQELFIDGTSGTVTSQGRSPISGMNLGTYIPPTIEIDGVHYPNPSNIGGDERGCFGFFEDWENISWGNIDNYTFVDATITKEGDWIKLTSTAAEGRTTVTDGEVAVTHRVATFLLKKGIGDLVHVGASAGSAFGVIYDWVNDTLTDQDAWYGVSHVRISDELVYIQVRQDEGGNRAQATVLLPNADESVYFKDITAFVDLEFYPPFGQDGNAKNPSRAYNFDKWDHPISFKFKPQFDFDVSSNKIIYTDRSSSALVTCQFFYDTGSTFSISVDGNLYPIGHNGTSWDKVTAFDSTTESILQEVHDCCVFMNKDSNVFNVWLDGEHLYVDEPIDLSGWEPYPVMSIGIPNYHADPSDLIFNGYISNFCVHPKTQALPVDQTKPFKDPNKQYGASAQWYLDQFGNFPGSSLLSGAGGIVEEGSNVNGSWIRFESGLLVQWFLDPAVNVTTSLYSGDKVYYYNIPLSYYYPTPFKVTPHLIGTAWSASGITWIETTSGSDEEVAIFYLLGANSTSNGSVSYLAIGY